MAVVTEFSPGVAHLAAYLSQTLKGCQQRGNDGVFRVHMPNPETNFISYSTDGLNSPPGLRFSQPRLRRSNKKDELWAASQQRYG